MTVWLDVHLSPRIARWVCANWNVPCVAVRDLGLGRANDEAIFAAARDACAVMVTKRV